MEQNLDKDYDYYLEHQEELAKDHLGKIVVITAGDVIGIFDTEVEAVNKTSQEHELGSFLVQKIEAPGSTSPQTYHSRVSFR